MCVNVYTHICLNILRVLIYIFIKDAVHVSEFVSFNDRAVGESFMVKDVEGRGLA
jgi:hypothetical protein